MHLLRPSVASWRCLPESHWLVSINTTVVCMRYSRLESPVLVALSTSRQSLHALRAQASVLDPGSGLDCGGAHRDPQNQKADSETGLADSPSRCRAHLQHDTMNMGQIGHFVICLSFALVHGGSIRNFAQLMRTYASNEFCATLSHAIAMPGAWNAMQP